LDDDASLALFPGKFLQLIGACGSRICHPHIAAAIHMNAVRPREHTGAKAADLFTGPVKIMDRGHFAADTTWDSILDTSIRCPYRLAVAVDGNAVRAAPRPSLDASPIANHTVGIVATVDGLNFVGLRSASARLRLQDAAAQRQADDDDCY